MKKSLKVFLLILVCLLFMTPFAFAENILIEKPELDDTLVLEEMNDEEMLQLEELNLNDEYWDSLTEEEKELVEYFNSNKSVEDKAIEYKENTVESANENSIELSFIENTPQGGMTAPIITITEADIDPVMEMQQANSVIAATATPGFTITSKTTTSVTVNVTYPTSEARGNVLVFWDFNQGTTIPSDSNNMSPYGGNIYRTNGSHTITGLRPGGVYVIASMWSTNGGNTFGGVNTICRKVQLPYTATESLTTYNGTYVYARMESTDKSAASTTNFNTWLSRMDTAYLAYKDLTGYTPYSGNKLGLQSSRKDFNTYMPDGKNYWELTWGEAGQPALISQPFMRSLMIRLSSNDWGDVTLHELSHAFDNNAWTFDAEVLADLKEYYVVEANNAKVYRSDIPKYYTGSAFYNFFNSDQLYSYNNTFNYGNYHSRGMTKIMIDIKNRIGSWTTFKSTFSYFNSLASGNIPSTAMGKLNLFLTKLKDYSGVEVLSVISSRDKNIIQSRFGGTLAYVVDPWDSATTISLNSTKWS